VGERALLATCRNCDSSLSEDDAFCGNCGYASPSAQSSSDLSVASDSAVIPETASAPRAQWSNAGSGGGSWVAAVQPGTSDGAAAGQLTPNAMYIGQRLLYDKVPESSFDPILNTRFLAQMFQKSLLYAFIWFAGGIPAWIFFGLITLVLGPLGWGLGIACTVVVWLVLTCCFWLLPLPAQLSEWKFSIDGKGEAGPVVFEHIAWVLKQRQTPLDTLQVKRLNLPGEGQRDYLELRRGLFRGYVACFPFGQDLYVGWTFWVSLSPARWVLMVIGRIWQTVAHRGTDLYVSLRFDSARAMREAMHNAAREGIDVAIGQLAGQGHGIIGSAIRIEETVQLAQ